MRFAWARRSDQIGREIQWHDLLSCRRPTPVDREDVRDITHRPRAHFEIPIDPFERSELAHCIHLSQPIAKTIVAHDSSLSWEWFKRFQTFKWFNLIKRDLNDWNRWSRLNASIASAKGEGKGGPVYEDLVAVLFFA